MGRYLALGIATSITIVNKRNLDLNKYKDQMLSDISKFVDISNYNQAMSGNNLEILIKPEYFNSNIHSLIKEVSADYNCEYFFGKEVDVDSEKFNPNDFPIYIERKIRPHSTYERFETNFDNSEECDMEGKPKYWIFKDENLGDNFGLSIEYIPLWIDFNKIFIESEYFLMKYSNICLHTHYKTPLGKNLMFFIFG